LLVKDLELSQFLIPYSKLGRKFGAQDFGQGVCLVLTL